MPGTLELEKPPIDTAETNAEVIESPEDKGVEAFLRDVRAEIRATRDPETIQEMRTEVHRNKYNHRLSWLKELYKNPEAPQWKEVFAKQRQEPTLGHVKGSAKGERRIELTPIEVVVQELEAKNPDLQVMLQNFLRGPEGLLNLLSQRNPKIGKGTIPLERDIKRKKDELLQRLPPTEEGRDMKAFVEHIADTEAPSFKRKKIIPNKARHDRAA